jgi:hypothetical protein
MARDALSFDAEVNRGNSEMPSLLDETQRDTSSHALLRSSLPD